MSSRKSKPQWWQLYIMLPILASGFLLEMRLRLSGTWHILAQVGILFMIYGFVHLWLGANRSALLGLEERHGDWRIHVYEIPAAETVGHPARPRPRPSVHWPEAEVKGVLSTTFHMDEFDESTAFPAGSSIFYSEDLLSAQDTNEAQA